MIRTAGIDHVHLHVRDVQDAVRFYSEVFGAEEAFRVGDRLVFLRLPQAHGLIALDGRPEDERNPAHVGIPLAEGGDLDAAVEAVLAAGGRLVERGEHAPGLGYAYIADPDGNVIEL
jgi:catechol 2,3-dioxygenase-like lactoylglutathione lyase family enzyme